MASWKPTKYLTFLQSGRHGSLKFHEMETLWNLSSLMKTLKVPGIA